MKTLSIILLTALAFTAFIGVAYVVRINQDDDPLAANKVELQKVRILKDIESLRLAQERERQESAKLTAKLAREKAEQERQATIQAAAIVVTSRTFAAAVWPVLPLFLLASGMTGAGLFYFFRRVPVETPFVKASLPVRRAAAIVEKSLTVSNAAEMGKALAFQHDISQQQIHSAVEIFRSLRPGRENITVNQSALPAATDDHPAHAVPTFSDLFHAGKFAPGKPLVFGFQENGQPKMGTWNHAYSLGIAGMSGSGKSSTIRFIMSESLLTGAVGKFYVIDPHYPHPESLLASLGDLKDAPQVVFAENPIDTAAMIEDIHAAIDRRLACKEASTPLLVVVVDELPVVVKKFPKIAELIERIGMESRKAGVYGIFSAQSWNSDKTGGTTARDNLTALLVHKMKRKQAHTLLQDADLTRQVLRLQPGQVLFSPTKGDPELLTVPFCAVEDMPDVVHVLSKGAKFGAGALQDDSGNENGGEMNTETNEPENASEGKIDNVVPFRRRNAEETAEKRQTKTETAFLSADTLREILAEKLARNEETLSGIANKANVSKGQLYRFLKENQNPSENLLTALQVFAGTAGTPANPTGTEA